MKIELTKTQVVNEEKAIPKKLWPFIAIFLRRHPLSLFVFSLFVFFEALVPAANAYLLKLLIDGVIATAEHLNQLLTVILVPALF